MLSTGSMKDAPLLASSDSDIFALVAANGRAKRWCVRPHARPMRAQAMPADVLLEKIAKKKNARFGKLFYLISALEFPDFVTI